MSYSLDVTGIASSNYISGERVLVTPQSLSLGGFIIPSYAPFFGNNLIVIYQPSNTNTLQTLTLGKDYQLDFVLPGFKQTTNTTVFGGIVLFNPNLSGTLIVSYQTLGGNWSFDLNSILNYTNSNSFNALTQYRQLVPSAPLYLPSDPTTIWPLDSISSITIAQAQMNTGITLSITYSNLGNVTNGPIPVAVPDKSIIFGAFSPTANSKIATISNVNNDLIALAANSSRRFLQIENLSNSGILYVNPLGLAFNTSTNQCLGIPIGPGQYRKWDIGVPNTAIHISSSTNVSYMILEG